MTNEKVILKFINKKCGHTPNRWINYGGYGCTLKTNGLELINYNTRIAYWENNAVIVNNQKYSRTTSKIQHQLYDLLEKNNIKYYKLIIE